MSYEDHIYIASCVFTKQYPALSKKIREYILNRFHMRIIRCCAANYKVEAFEKDMPAGYQTAWKRIPHYQEFESGETMVSICHNCSAIFQESRPDIHVKSIWELLLEDDSFAYPDYHQESMTLQDCWRAKGNDAEKAAVRELIQRMNIRLVELPEPQEDFCGISLYRPAPPRNLKMAPKRFVQGAPGKFQAHTPEEQKQLMETYCRKFKTDKVIAYCHYCAAGLNLGGKQGIHLGELLFN